MCAICDYLGTLGRRSKSHSGRTRQFVCPVHDDTGPSFTVWHAAGDDHWKCFGCGSNGDLVGLIRQVEFGQLPDREAFVRAYERAKELGHEVTDRRVRPVLNRIEVPNRLRREALTLAATYYHEQLMAGSNPGQGYLRARGLSRAFAQDYMLGYCAGSASSARALRELVSGELHAELGRLGILYPDRDPNTGEPHPFAGRERMRGRIIIPNLRSGKVVWLQGRATLDHPIRYLGVHGPREGLFGLDSLGWPGPKVIVEGFFDIAPFLAAKIGGVAFLGNVDWGLEAITKPLTGQEVIIARDQGKAGQVMAEKVVRHLQKLARSLKVVVPPVGSKDPCDWVQHWGLGELLAAAAIAQEEARA